MLTHDMKRIIKRYTVGFVATITPDGKPAVSPKGMSIILDDNTLVIGNIRSPQTARNININPAVEVNYLDVLSRKAVRISGSARYVKKGTEEFDILHPCFHRWSNLSQKLRGIFVINIESAKIITSPVYDLGMKEKDLRRYWRAYFSDELSHDEIA